MSRVKKILLIVLVVVIVIQFIQPVENKNGQMLPTDISNIYSIPENIHIILKNACYDCHSNNTNYPFYSFVQPIRWEMERDIKNGKEKLNFSEFGTYSPRKRNSKWLDIRNRIKDESMPLFSYKLAHKNARISKKDIKLLIDWIEKITI